MLKYILKRLLLIIPIVMGVVIVVFTINYFSTGSAALTVLGTAATPENVAALEAEMGLDDPYFVQIGRYFWNIISKGDMGNSYIYQTPVWSMIKPRILPTSVVGFAGILLAIIIGIPLGVLSATKQNTIVDYASSVVSITLNAVPHFWLALMLMLYFGVKLRILPITGYTSWKNYILPVISCGLAPLTSTQRMARSTMLEVIRQDYIRTARSKGLSNTKVLYKHALKNALIPVITLLGTQLGIAFSGAIIVETIFQIPGLGTLMSTSISQNDYIVTQGCVIICGAMVAIANLITDICYALVDPRVKAQYESISKHRLAVPKLKAKEAAK